MPRFPATREVEWYTTAHAESHLLAVRPRPRSILLRDFHTSYPELSRRRGKYRLSLQPFESYMGLAFSLYPAILDLSPESKPLAKEGDYRMDRFGKQWELCIRNMWIVTFSYKSRATFNLSPTIWAFFIKWKNYRSLKQNSTLSKPPLKRHISRFFQ